MSTVIPTFLLVVDSFDKTRFRFIARHPSILLWELETGERGDVLPFHLIKSHIVYEFFVGKIEEMVRMYFYLTISAMFVLMNAVEFDLGRLWCWRKNKADTKG